jgi:hypothetical protein
MARHTGSVTIAIAGIFACLLSYGNAARAEGFTFSGFGSVGIVHENARDLGFTRYITQPQPENNDTSYLTDSLLGLQANYAISPQLEAVGQLVLRDQKYGNFNRSLEWAYLKWRPDTNVDLRFGRIGADAFMLSDYRHVGFAQLWARPPGEFYGWIPIFSINGADASYRFRTGNTYWQLKGQLGNSKSQLPTGPDTTYAFEADKFRSLSLRAENGPWQFMTAITALRVGSEAVPSLVTNWLTTIGGAGFIPPAIRAEAQELNKGLWTEGASVRYLTFGGSYQEGPWQVQAEIAKVRSDSNVLPNGLAAYIVAGRRFGSVTPYGVLSTFRSDRAAAHAQADWSALGPDAVTLQNAALGAYSSNRIDQNGVALGMRWDINSRTALKLQWDRKEIEAKGYGLWQINNIRNGDRDRTVNIFSAVLDFTF